MAPPPEVHIHYHRPPDRTDIYVQSLVLDAPEVKVTFQPSTPIPKPVVVGEQPVLEPGSPAVWFTFPGLWHDIGRFHDAQGRFTGIYANVLTPCELHAPEDGGVLRWDTTDLFLDVWMGADGRLLLLDEPDLAEAVSAGSVTEEVAARARREAQDILARARAGAWPPPVVSEWTLERIGYEFPPRT